MQKVYPKRWMVFWLSFSLSSTALIFVHAALLDLDAFVTFSIFDSSGVNPLPNGAIVYIVGSSNNIADPMQAIGTNLLAGSTTGDDMILGVVRIGDNNASNGTFTITVQYNPDNIQYAYIRFFNYTNAEPITGLVFFGTSAIFELVPTLGVSRVDFNPNQNLSTDNINNFIVIPEPGTANLLILFFGMLGGLRARMKRQQREALARGPFPG